MKTLRSFYIIILIVSISCKNQPNEVLLNCALTAELLERDQNYRGAPELKSSFFFVLDSLLKNEGFAKGIDNTSSVPDEKYRALHTMAKKIDSTRDNSYHQATVDSLWKLQKQVDYENTVLLLSAIKNTGYDHIDSMDSDCSYKAFIVFLHTPNELKEEVREVIVKGKEYLSTNQYNHIMWHLNGRQGNPFTDTNF